MRTIQQVTVISPALLLSGEAVDDPHPGSYGNYAKSAPFILPIKNLVKRSKYVLSGYKAELLISSCSIRRKTPAHAKRVIAACRQIKASTALIIIRDAAPVSIFWYTTLSGRNTNDICRISYKCSTIKLVEEQTLNQNREQNLLLSLALCR
jgi:hypothetical protein